MRIVVYNAYFGIYLTEDIGEGWQMDNLRARQPTADCKALPAQDFGRNDTLECIFPTRDGA